MNEHTAEEIRVALRKYGLSEEAIARQFGEAQLAEQALSVAPPDQLKKLLINTEVLLILARAQLYERGG